MDDGGSAGIRRPTLPQTGDAGLTAQPATFVIGQAEKVAMLVVRPSE